MTTFNKQSSTTNMQGACLEMSENEALNKCFSTPQDENVFSALFSKKENDEINSLHNSSLYEMVEQIISLFKVGSWYNEAIFIQAFQDVVFNFTTTKAGDLYSFLKWWDKSGCKKSVSTPDNPLAFRIMTIHKSKGLDFKVVIIPFCDWEMDKKSGYFKNVLWCAPSEQPFNELPLLPVEYSSSLANSIFAKNYFDELMHQYIDNLNVAYVAFTRTKHELYCFSPLPNKEPESVEKINTLADLLYFSFLNSNDISDEYHLNENFDEEKHQFSIGEQVEYHYTEEKLSAETTEKIKTYHSANSTERLKIKHNQIDLWLSNQQLNDSRLNYGIIMHDILCRIRVKADQQNAIQHMVREGRINENEAQIVLSEMELFWNLPHVNDWFTEDKHIVNEANILTEGGSLYRPDRVVIHGNKAVVVDYKFGDIESPNHHRQVKKYMELIALMGYSVSGISLLCGIIKGN